MTSEITEAKDEETPCFISKEAQKERIRKLIDYQKALYWSSSSSSSLSSSAASCSSFSSSRRRSSLLELMKGGSTSLRRLFDMEHTTLATHFYDYSGSPVIKSIPLWGNDEEFQDPWEYIKQIRTIDEVVRSDERSKLASDGSFMEGEFGFKGLKKRETNRPKLTRKESFRRLPGFGRWRWRGFRFKLRLRKRPRIMICGKIF